MNAALIQLLDSVLPPKSCAYVAGPLDHGRAYYEGLAAGLKQPHLRSINEQILSRFAESLRARLPYPVFDPGHLKIEGWKGHDYSVFFLEVVERYAKEVWFLDGWQFSHGATKEFVLCCRESVPCLDQSGRPLTTESGRALIEEAAKYVDALGLNGSTLRSRLWEPPSIIVG